MNINIENLVVRRGDFTLGEINLNLKGGYIYALIGDNGAGKTTLLQSILGALDINSGNIYFDKLGFKNDYEKIKSYYSYIADDLIFNNAKITKILDAIEFFDNRFDKNKCLKILNLFEININQKIKTLSKGNIKKFQFAIGISINCEVLILDEPTR